MISSEAQQRKSLNNHNKQFKAFWFFSDFAFLWIKQLWAPPSDGGYVPCTNPDASYSGEQEYFLKTMYWVYIHVGVHKRHPRICIYVEDKGFFASPFWALARALSSLESSSKVAWSVGSKNLEIGFWLAIVGSFLHQMSLVIYCWKAPVQIHF